MFVAGTLWLIPFLHRKLQMSPDTALEKVISVEPRRYAMRFQRSKANMHGEIVFQFGGYYVHDELGCRITKQLIISVFEYDVPAV